MSNIQFNSKQPKPPKLRCRSNNKNQKAKLRNHRTYTRWWIFFIFSPILGEMIQFDEYFSNGLVEPPTSISKYPHFGHWITVFHAAWWPLNALLLNARGNGGRSGLQPMLKRWQLETGVDRKGLVEMRGCFFCWHLSTRKVVDFF